MQELEQIQAFKYALNHPSEDEDLDDSATILTTNRGNKLKRAARYVSSRSIAVPKDDLGVTIVDFNGQKRAVLSRNDDEEAPSLLDEIDVSAILQPITDPAQVPQHPSISRTFESTCLGDMAKETLDIIVEEKGHATRISNLLSAFLGDNARDLQSVPEALPAATDAANFFSVPDLGGDRSFGVNEEMAEEARQLLQIAHQRMDEFVQCMTQIRMGLLHANRRKRSVYNWCKELNGQDYVEEEIDDGGDEPNSAVPWTATDFQDVSASMTERSD